MEAELITPPCCTDAADERRLLYVAGEESMERECGLTIAGDEL